MNGRSRRSSALFALALLITWVGGQPARAQPAPASRPEASLELGVGTTDNLNRDADEIRSDIAILGAAFTASRDERRLRGELAGDLSYLKYGAEEIADDDEVLGSVDGLLDLHAVPERFRWEFRSAFGQVRTDPREAISPLNRQRTRVLSTGPALSIPFGGRNTLEFSGQVAERRYETSEELDSRLKTTRVGLRRDVGPVTRLSLTFEQSENDFELQPETYEFDIVSVEYRKELASGFALASVGRGEVEIGDTAESTAVARLAWNRDVATRSRLEIWAGRELTDAGTLFANGGAVSGQGPLSGLMDVARTTDGRLQGVVLSRSPLRRENVGARFAVVRELSTFGVSVGSVHDRFENDVALDNDATTIELTASHRFGQMWEGVASASRWEQDFKTTGESEDQYLRLAVNRLVGRSSRLGVTLERNRRTSTVDPFDENRVIVSLAHDFRRE